MKKVKRIIGILMIGIMASTILAGCINEPAPSSMPQAEAGEDSGAGGGVLAASGDQITLRLTWWSGDERNETALAVIDQYQKLHPEVRIEVEVNSDQRYIDKVSVMLVNDTAPDILQQSVDSLSGFVSRGDFFVDFCEYKNTFDTPDLDETSTGQFGTPDGKFLALLTGMSCSTTVANKNAARTCSVDLTKRITWDSMLKDGKKLHAENPSYHYMNTGAKILCEYVLRPYLRQITGGLFIIDSERKMSFTRDQLVEVLTYIKDCYDGSVFEPAEDSVTSKGQIHINPKWMDGKFILVYGPSPSINLLMDAVPEAERVVVQMPMAKNRVNDGSFADTLQYMTVNENSGHVEEAADSLNYFHNSVEAQETLKGVRSIPPMSTARQLCTDKGLSNQTVVDTADLAAGLNGRNDKGYTTSAEVYAIQEDMIESIVHEQSTPEGVAGNAIELINDYLSGLRWKVPEPNIKEVGRQLGHPFPGRLKDRRKIGRQRRS